MKSRSFAWTSYLLAGAYGWFEVLGRLDVVARLPTAVSIVCFFALVLCLIVASSRLQADLEVLCRNLVLRKHGYLAAHTERAEVQKLENLLGTIGVLWVLPIVCAVIFGAAEP